MKLSLILFLNIIASVTVAQYTTDRYYKVDTIKKYGISSYEKYELKNDTTKVLKEKLSFDKKGNLTEILYPQRNEWEKFIYDSENKIVESVSCCKKINLYEKSKYFYTDNLLDSVYISDSTQIKYIKRYYYSDSLLIQSETERVNSNRNYKVTWYNSYDQNGYLKYSGRTEGSKKHEFVRDSRGKLISFIVRKDGNITLIHHFEYDGELRTYGCYKNLTVNSDNAYKIEYNQLGLPIKHFICQGCSDEGVSNCSLKYVYQYNYR